MAVDRSDWSWDGKFGLFELSGSARGTRDAAAGATQADIDFSWISAIDARDVMTFRTFAAERRLLIVMRCPKPPALVFHGLFPAKNAHTSEKTSEESGLVTGASGTIMVSDYDLMCVARHNDAKPGSFARIPMTAEGKGVKYGRWDPKAAEMMRDLNGRLVSRIQHGAQDDFQGQPHPGFFEKGGVPPRCAAFRFVPGAVTAECLILSSADVARRFYRRVGLDWRYDPSGHYIGPQAV